MTCPVCGYEMAAPTTDVTPVPGLGVGVTNVYFCCACAQWHHIEVTDPDQADRLRAVAAVFGEPR